MDIDFGKIQIEVSMDVKDLMDHWCPFCGGTGKVKAATLARTMDGGVVRGPDIKTDCIWCNGTGRVKTGRKDVK